MYFDDGSWLSRRGRLSRPRSSLLESTASSSELSVSPTIEREGAGVVLAGHQEAPHDQHAERSPEAPRERALLDWVSVLRTTTTSVGASKPRLLSMCTRPAATKLDNEQYPASK